MPRLRQVGRDETDAPIVHMSYDVVFGPGGDPTRGDRTDTGTTGGETERQDQRGYGTNPTEPRPTIISGIGPRRARGVRRAV